MRQDPHRQAIDPGKAGTVEDFRGCATRHDAAAAHGDDFVAIARRHVDVVQHDDDTPYKTEAGPLSTSIRPPGEM